MTKDAIARERLDAVDRLLTELDRRYSQRFDAQERANNLALDAAEKAVLKAENAAERRFESQNEFRGTLSDQARTLMPRAEVEALFAGVTQTLQRLENNQITIAGRGQGMGSLLSYMIAVAGVLIAVVVAIFK